MCLCVLCTFMLHTQIFSDCNYRLVLLFSYGCLYFFKGSWERKLIDRINNVEKKRKRHHQKEDGSEDETPRKRGRPKKPKNLEYYLVDVPDEYDKALYDRHMQVCW